MSDNLFTHIMKFVWAVAFFTFCISIALPFAAEYISGDEILNDYIEPSKDIEANVTLAENEKVTIVFKTNEISSDAEVLNIYLVDPQKREFSWTKSLDASDEAGTTTIDFFSFTPETSGIYNLKVNNSDFQTQVKVVSGMITPSKQPSFLPLVIASLIVVFIGVFSKSIRKGVYNHSLSDAILFIISVSLSLFIVYEVIIL